MRKPWSRLHGPTSAHPIATRSRLSSAPGLFPPASGRSTTSVLRSPDFRVLWLATVCYQIGLGMQQVLLGWVIFAMTGSGGMVGTVFAMRSAPNLVVGFAAGAITDWLDRRTLMRLAAFVMAIVAMGMAWLAFGDRLQVWHILCGTGLLGMCQAFEMTARQAYVVDMVSTHNAVQGLALISLAQRLGGVLGSLLAGATLEWWGAGPSFLVMSLCYGTGASVLFALRHRGISAPAIREPVWQNVCTYWRALQTNRDMRTLILSTGAAEVLGFSHQVMLPILAKDVLHVSAAGLGILTAFRFLGGMLGVGLLTALGEVQRRGRLLLVVLSLFGAGVVLLSQAPHFWLAIVCVMFINVMASVTDILHHTLLQLSVANEQRGRAMGSWIVGTGTAPIGHLEIGHLASLTTARLALLVNGIALLLLPLAIAILLPRLRRL